MSNFKRPLDIDEPPMILFWEVPQFLIGVSAVSLGIVMQSASAMVVFGYLGVKYLLNEKRNAISSKRGEYPHSMWAKGMRTDKKLRHYPINIRDVSGK